MIRVTFCLLLWCTAVTTGVSGQETNRQPIEVRQPPQEKIADYASQRAFSYEGVPPKSETLIDRLKYWIRDQWAKLTDNPVVEKIFEIIVFLGFGLLIIFVLNKVIGTNITGLFTGKKVGSPNASTIEHESGAQENLEKLIEEAIANQQFRLATRYLYQDGLKKLQNSGYIDWEKDKTNRDYLYEIKKEDLRKVFREITRYYEYAEYGNFTLSSDRFSKVYDRFKEMRTLIQSSS